MLLGMDFMMESWVASLIVVNVIVLHNNSFPPKGQQIGNGYFYRISHCILTRNLLCLPWLQG